MRRAVRSMTTAVGVRVGSSLLIRTIERAVPAGWPTVKAWSSDDARSFDDAHGMLPPAAYASYTTVSGQVDATARADRAVAMIERWKLPTDTARTSMSIAFAGTCVPPDVV